MERILEAGDLQAGDVSPRNLNSRVTKEAEVNYDPQVNGR